MMVRFEYDELNHTAVSTDSLGNQWRYEHTPQGLLTRKVSPEGNAWRYRYDNLSRKVAEITPDGGVTRYRYNAYGQLCEVEVPDNSLGRLLSQTGPDGATRKYDYDRQGRVTRVEDANGHCLRYWWNERGQLAAEQDGEAITRYSYDGLGQINGIINGDGWVTQYSRNIAGHITGITQYYQDSPDNRRTRQIEYDTVSLTGFFLIIRFLVSEGIKLG